MQNPADCVARQLATRNRKFALLAVLVLGMASGCNGKSPIADENPGVYKGTIDPLTLAPADKRSIALSERFKLIQGRQ